MRHHRKVVQAKHVPDEEFLRVVEVVRRRRYEDSRNVNAYEHVTALTWDVAAEMPAIPFKVMLAKADRLIERGLLDGCACGCRGGFSPTFAGCQLLHVGRGR